MFREGLLRLCIMGLNEALIPQAQLAVRGGRFLLSRVLFLAILLAVYVFVVYISLRDERR
jgi:hypothetical protein